jgi:hypothetical protein
MKNKITPVLNEMRKPFLEEGQSQDVFDSEYTNFLTSQPLYSQNPTNKKLPSLA